jgi:GT2 family glycosyltransferase
MPLVDIIAVLYGDRKDFDRLVKSIEDNCANYNLIIIDNNPPQENLGFTKAINKGISQGKADYIWLLNQDAVVLPKAQEALITRLKSHPKIGIAGSMQLDYDNNDMIRHGGTTRAFPGGVHAGGYLSMGHCRFPSKQTWVNYASVMFKREMVNQIGLLDESMYLVYSDSDYCYYARSKGWECWYEPDSKVLHRLNVSKTVTEWHRKDMEAFMKKWDIQHVGNNNFTYGPLFAKLDRFP